MKAQNGKYRFSIQWAIAGNQVAIHYVTPFNTKDFKLTEQEYEGNKFTRVNFSGNVILRNHANQNDYDIIKNIEQDTDFAVRSMRLYFVIEKNTATQNYPVWEEEWRGYFSPIVDCKYNDDDCIVEFTPTVWDKYSCLLNEYDIEHNIASLYKTTDSQYTYATGATMPGNIKCEFATGIYEYGEPEPYTALQVSNYWNPPAGLGVGDCAFNTGVLTFGQTTGEGQFPVSAGWQVFENDIYVDKYSLIGSSANVYISTKYIREVSYEDTQVAPAGSGWISLGLESYLGNLKYKYVRPPIDASIAVYNQTLCREHDGFLGNGAYSEYYALDISSIQTVVYYNYGKFLFDVIDYLVEEADCEGRVSEYYSDFFLSTANPVLMDNFGESRTFRYLTLHQASNIKDPTASEPATKWNISLKTLLEALKEMFQVYWFIDDDGRFRIEHISHPAFGQTANTQNLNLIEQGAFTRRKNKYEYIKEELPSKEHWTQPIELANTDFKGVDIIYLQTPTNSRVESNTKQHTISIMTDLEIANNSPTDVSNDGFYLIDSHYGINDATPYNGLVVNEDFGKLSGEKRKNNVLSIANLQHYFWKHDRPLLYGTMNNEETTFFTKINTIVQEPIKLPICYDLNFYDPVTTEMGTGKIDKSEKTLYDETKTLTITYASN